MITISSSPASAPFTCRYTFHRLVSLTNCVSTTVNSRCYPLAKCVLTVDIGWYELVNCVPSDELLIVQGQFPLSLQRKVKRRLQTFTPTTRQLRRNFFHFIVSRDRCHLNRNWAFRATFHLTISLPGQRATGKIQGNNYLHGNCGPSLTC